MKTFKQYSNTALFFTLFMMTFFMGGCGGSSSCEDTSRTPVVLEGVTPPTVVSTIPTDGAIDVPLNRTLSALISEDLDPNTTGQNTFRLYDMTDPLVEVEVNGTVAYANRIMTFDPDLDLVSDTNYTARISASIADLEGTTMGAPYEWSFTTANAEAALAQGPDPVILGRAGDFAILTKAGISNTVTALTDITGDIGVSPIDHTAITGFALIGDVTTDTFLTSPYVTGNVYAANLVAPTPDKMTAAVSDMETAYTDAAGRPAAVGANLNIGGGTLNNTTPAFAPGLYTWGTDVTITGSITLTGNADDTWIFQISGNLILASSAQIILGPNVQAKNIVWQVAGTDVTIGTGAQFSGIILAKEKIAVQTNASVDGRLLSQTAVTLDQNIITQPAP